jgi:glyoxylase-like metal-dependent hydrolase (beta-lactamase superfamily II)
VVSEIDTRHLGRKRVIAAHAVRGLIVDPGPESALGNWIGELREAPQAVLLTHIHLDHAGATGTLVRRFPGLRVYVSAVGAPHVIDPSRLLASAGRLYGEENMDSLWGEVAAVPASSVVTVADGDEVEGMRVLETPGHARHHVAYVDLGSGDAYVGDLAGVRIPPAELTIAPTPPPEIEIEAWLDSLDRIEALRPERLRLTHFGLVEDASAQLERARASLRMLAERARGGNRDAFLAGLDADLRAGADEETVASLTQAVPPEQAWLGLERYWRKREQAGEAR